MIVCICHRISDRELARHAGAGMNFDSIQLETGVATRCGQCESRARDVVARGLDTSDSAALESYCGANRFATIQIQGQEWNTLQRWVPA